jgi:SAM-dependent methyltransferase
MSSPLPFRLADILACPSCKRSLVLQDRAAYQCLNGTCQKRFPIVNGIPVLINEDNSLFTIKDFLPRDDRPLRGTARENALGRALRRIVPSITHNWNTAANYDGLAKLLRKERGESLILIVGCGDEGTGLARLLKTPGLRFVETDVYFGSRVQIIADGHDLPFETAVFDAIICQAVLEHVVDPYRCVEEMHRVLKKDGLIYAETPFLYPVHMKGQDFSRFTLGGHRRLFRHFAEIDAGVVLGPSIALALAIRSLFLSVSGSAIYRKVCNFVIPFFVFWLKYVDYFLVNRPPAADAAAGVYFLGRRGEDPLLDRDLLRWHWTTSAR